MQVCSPDPAAQFIWSIFKAKDHDAAALENRFASQLTSGRQRKHLGVPQSRLADSAVPKQRACEAPAKTSAKKPGARRWYRLVVTCVPAKKLALVGRIARLRPRHGFSDNFLNRIGTQRID